MTEPTNLQNHFLLAMPHMEDACFSQSLTLICEHSDRGAMGIIVNKPTDIPLTKAFKGISMEGMTDDQRIYAGGPISTDRAFVLHSPPSNWSKSATLMTDKLFLSTSSDVVKAISDGSGPEHYLIAVGYAGWESGQLENEIRQNDWLVVPANIDILFHTPSDKRLNSAANILGIDLSLMSSHTGHA